MGIAKKTVKRNSPTMLRDKQCRWLVDFARRATGSSSVVRTLDTPAPSSGGGAGGMNQEEASASELLKSTIYTKHCKEPTYGGAVQVESS
jgi:hypothetical protein